MSVDLCLDGLIQYEIKEGDTFDTIAEKQNINVKAIKAANPTVNPDRLQVGQTLCLPQDQNLPQCDKGHYYFIQQKDTFDYLSHTFYIPIEQIQRANPRVNPKLLQVGQAICIPTSDHFFYCPEKTTPYQIKQGDNFYKLSRNFRVSIESIVKLNRHMNPYKLIVGQYICLPIQWRFYFDQAHHVAFMYPQKWSKVHPEPYEPIRYEGDNGYFEISSIIAASPSKPENITPIDEVCHDYAYGKFNPYGTKPKIKKMIIDGQKACLILPSDDQSKEYNNQAAFILKYPKPYYIQSEAHHYLYIKADDIHIKSMIQTLKLLNIGGFSKEGWRLN